eukprot:GILJ01005711.1.p1 GENE.GILJ01005711.1~~GILJ01005711.1.p1  ORF type:complete len:174 (-),score=24.38 GILJ01005711.1:131-652(-)
MSRTTQCSVFFCLLVLQAFAQEMSETHLRRMQANAISSNTANAIGIGNTANINSVTAATANSVFPAVAGGFPGSAGFSTGFVGLPFTQTLAAAPKKTTTALPVAQTLVAAPVAKPVLSNLTPVIPITSPVLQNIIGNVQKKLFGPPGPTVVVVKQPQTVAIPVVTAAAPPPKK